MYPNTPCLTCADCPTGVTPTPLPDFHGICGDAYPLSCVKYTGENIECLGITTGMSITQILNIFQTVLETNRYCNWDYFYNRS